WTVAHETDRAATLLSMTELVVLGGGSPAAFNAWGTYALRTTGCLCARLARPAEWRSWWGLSQEGLPAILVADLPLNVAVVLHNLHLPAVLARPVLAAAMQDFVDATNPTDGNDWLTLARAAQAVDRTRFEDYIASAAADGPLVAESGEADRYIMRTMSLTIAGVLLIPVFIPLFIRAQTNLSPQLEIVSPASDAYLSGTTVFRATLTPPDAAARILFSVDGKQVCDAPAPPFECSWEAGSAVMAHQIRVVADLKAGGRVIKTLRTRSLGYAEKVDVDVVQVIATVMDSSGHFVTGIEKSAFHLEEDGRLQTISHFGAEDVPLELIVACDVSGSMTPAMPRLKSAVKEFLAAVPTRDQVTLLGFNDSIFALTRRQVDPAERLKAVDRLAPWGATALYDVILRGV